MKNSRVVLGELLRVLAVGFLGGAIVFNFILYLFLENDQSETIRIIPTYEFIATILTLIIIGIIFKIIKIPHPSSIVLFGIFPIMYSSSFADELSLPFIFVDKLFFNFVLKAAVVQGLIASIGLGLIYLIYSKVNSQ